jgi:hypothetical protein
MQRDTQQFGSKFCIKTWIKIDNYNLFSVQYMKVCLPLSQFVSTKRSADRRTHKLQSNYSFIYGIKTKLGISIHIRS